MPAEERSYTFESNTTSLSFPSTANSQSVTITSTTSYTTHTHNQGTVNAGTELSLTHLVNTVNNEVVPYSSSASGTGLSVSGSTISYSNNQSNTSTTNQRNGTVTFTQNGSGETIVINCTQQGRVMYRYTINSNCNGGTVYANNVSKGTISGGRLVFYDTNSSRTIRISGGVPSDTSELIRNDTETEYIFGNNDVSIDCTYQEETRSVGFESTKRTITTPVYEDTEYSAPANKTCNGNGSVTMNYTSSSSTRYGSSSTGSKQSVSIRVISKPAWVSVLSHSGGTNGIINFTVHLNDTQSERSDVIEIEQAEGNESSKTITINQAAMEIETTTIRGLDVNRWNADPETQSYGINYYPAVYDTDYMSNPPTRSNIQQFNNNGIMLSRNGVMGQGGYYFTFDAVVTGSSSTRSWTNYPFPTSNYSEAVAVLYPNLRVVEYGSSSSPVKDRSLSEFLDGAENVWLD